MMKEEVSVQLIYPQIDASEIKFIPFKTAILYRYSDHHAANDEEEEMYVGEINTFLFQILQLSSFVDFFIENHCAITINQLENFLEYNRIDLTVPNTRRYYCYEEHGCYVLNSGWFYDKRVTPVYNFSYDGVEYRLSREEKVYLADSMNKRLAILEQNSRWFVDDEESEFGAFVCEASKYLVPAFYKFYKDTDGADSYYLCEYGVGFGDCPGLAEAISQIREQLTKVTFKLSSQTPFDYCDETLIYTGFEEVRDIIKKNKQVFRRMSELS